MLVLEKDGTVCSWGENLIFRRYAGHYFGRNRVTQIACGINHSLALNEEGEIFSWGTNGFGQLGNINAKAACNVESCSDNYSEHPRKVKVGEQLKIVQIACGDSTSYALDNDGKVNIWFTSKNCIKACKED